MLVVSAPDFNAEIQVLNSWEVQTKCRGFGPLFLNDIYCIKYKNAVGIELKKMLRDLLMPFRVKCL